MRAVLTSVNKVCPRSLPDPGAADGGAGKLQVTSHTPSSGPAGMDFWNQISVELKTVQEFYISCRPPLVN